jgi:hypothetical protein
MLVGEQHFYNLENAFGPGGTASLYSERDLAKVSLCKLQGISLILIPHWYAFIDDELFWL